MPTVPANLSRIIVGVDPSGSGCAKADECGIVVAAIDRSNPSHAFVLADFSGQMSPNEWAERTVTAFRSFGAACCVVEQNFGDGMCEAVLGNIDASLPIKNVVSSRRKALRAEPVASLWEQKRRHLVGSLPQLEDEMTSFTKEWDRGRDGSPGRLDAMCFAIAELVTGVGTFDRDMEVAKLQALATAADEIPIPAALRVPVPRTDPPPRPRQSLDNGAYALIKEYKDKFQAASLELTHIGAGVCARCDYAIAPGSKYVRKGELVFHEHCIDSFCM